DELERAARRHEWAGDLTSTARRRLERERGRRRRHLDAALSRIDRAGFVARGRRLAKSIDPSVEDVLWRALATLVYERAEGVGEAIDECGTIYVPDRLHSLRIA